MAADAPAVEDPDAPADDAEPNAPAAPAAGGEPTRVPAEDVEALLAAAAEGSVELPPEDDEPLPEPAEPEDDASAEAPAAAPAPTAAPVGGQVEKLLEEVEAGLRSGGRPSVLHGGEAAPGDLGEPSPLALESFGEAAAGGGAVGSLDALDDVELDLRIELGRTQMRLDEVVGLRDGSVVTLDKLAGDPVDVLVNGRLVARGEVLVLNDNFCVRVAEILAPDE